MGKPYIRIRYMSWANGGKTGRPVMEVIAENYARRLRRSLWRVALAIWKQRRLKPKTYRRLVRNMK